MTHSPRSLRARLVPVSAAALCASLAVAAASAAPPGGTSAAPTGYTKKLTDIAYAKKSASQKLDLYLPKAGGKPSPLVVKIHGGAFMGGDKSGETAGVTQLLASGFAVATVNYRLSGEATFPAGVQDVKAAVRFLRANAKKYNLDPKRFATWGESAGGHLAAIVGTSGGQKSVLDGGSLGNAGVSSAVQAVVDWYGPTNFLTMDAQAKSPGGCPTTPQAHDPASSPESIWLGAGVQTVKAKAKQASPITYIKAGTTPPFYIAHGNADCLVPYGQSLELARALKAAKVTTKLVILNGASHGDARFDTTQTAPSIAFLKKALA